MTIPSEAGAPVAERKSLIDVSGIEVVYGSAILAVADVSLTIGEGEIVALLGANGAGKSTVLKAISGLAAADRAKVVKGHIRFGGEDILGIPANRLASRGIVHVLEGRHVFPHLTVEENLLTGAFLQKPGRRELLRQLDDIYAWFPRLKDKRKTQAGLTSGGEQQMLAIARALMSRPRVLLLDEPSLGLAPKVIAELFAALDRLRREGMTLLLVDQMAGLALALADRAYVMEGGRIVAQGTATEIAADGALAAAYLGEGAPPPVPPRLERVA